MLDTRLGASFTLAMPFIVVMLCVSVFGAIRTYETQGLIPDVGAELEELLQTGNDNLFGTLKIHIDTVASISTAPTVCKDITLEVDILSKLLCSNSTIDETPEDLRNNLLFCSIDVTCDIENTVAGDQNVLFSVPKAFQILDWSVRPGESWNFIQYQINHTLRSSIKQGVSQTLSGSKLDPTGNYCLLVYLF